MLIPMWVVWCSPLLLIAAGVIFGSLVAVPENDYDLGSAFLGFVVFLAGIILALVAWLLIALLT